MSFDVKSLPDRLIALEKRPLGAAIERHQRITPAITRALGLQPSNRTSGAPHPARADLVLGLQLQPASDVTAGDQADDPPSVGDRVARRCRGVRVHAAR